MIAFRVPERSLPLLRNLTSLARFRAEVRAHEVLSRSDLNAMNFRDSTGIECRNLGRRVKVKLACPIGASLSTRLPCDGKALIVKFHSSLSEALFLHVEAEIHDIAVLDDVIGTLEAHSARIFGTLLAAISGEIVIGDRLGPDKPLLEIGMDSTGGLRRLGSSLDRPGMCFLWSHSEEGDEVKELVTGPDDTGETGRVEPESCQKFSFLIGIGKLRELCFDRRRYHHRAGAALRGVLANAAAVGVPRGGTRLVDIGDIEDRLGAQELQCRKLSFPLRRDDDSLRRLAVAQRSQHGFGDLELRLGF